MLMESKQLTKKFLHFFPISLATFIVTTVLGTFVLGFIFLVFLKAYVDIANIGVGAIAVVFYFIPLVGVSVFISILLGIFVAKKTVRLADNYYFKQSNSTQSFILNYFSNHHCFYNSNCSLYIR
jgi:hypothetical protein